MNDFEGFVRAMPVPVLMQRDAKIVLANRAFTEVFGYPEAAVVGRPVVDLIYAPDRAYIAERIALGIDNRAGSPLKDHRLQHFDGSPCEVAVTIVPVYLDGKLTAMAVIRDLRERKRLEAQLIAADRMASLGRLAAAVGHEVNNPLSYVLGSLTLLERQIDELDELADRAGTMRALVGAIREGSERIRAVVRDLRALSRETADAVAPVDLARLLDLTAAMADHEVRHRARLVKAYGALPPVVGTEARLGQVFLNLLVNAAQAIPEGNVSGNEVRIEASASEGGVTVDVVDTGAGIDAAVAERIFEPFFTTKPSEGTGLGLSISRHVLASVGGSIRMISGEPRGTRFRVFLPCAEELDVPSSPADAERAPVAAGTARVLVIDDEPLLARTIADLLGPASAEVALGGESALAKLRAGATYDVLLCDLQMPDCSGMDVFDHVRREWPGLERRIVFMTGGALTARAAELVATTACPVLEKPFDARALEDAIVAARAR